MPRPPKKLSKQDLQEIESLAGLGLPQKQIARIKGLSVDTLRKYALEAFHSGKAKALARVAKTAFEMAVSGQNTAMTIFYLKTQGGFHEKADLPDYVLKALGLNPEEEDEA